MASGGRIVQAHVTRIAICLPDLRGGGAERTAVQIANGLAGRGFRVDLVALRLDGQYRREISPDVNVVDLNVSRARYAILPLTGYFKTEKPAVAFSVLLNIPVLISSLLGGRAVKVVLSERSHFSFARKSAKSLNAWISAGLAKHLYRFADKIVSVSKAGAADLEESGVIPVEKICTIYNPVINERVFMMQEERPGHEWFDDEERPLILSVGRLASEKDYATLIRAFALLQDRSARLVILGEGNERQALENLAVSLGVSDRVSLPGFQVNPYAYLARADVFVLCSLYEGLPGVLIQAMACGLTPVVADSPGGSAEILGDSLSDYLVPPRDPAALSEAIAKALLHPLPPGKLRERAMVFSEDASIDAYEKLIHELCG